MKPHLIAAVTAVFLAVAVLTGFDLYARQTEERYVRALAPQHFDLKNQGTALQASAFRQSDLLPVYGSSELNIAEPYHASDLFKSYPTGFTIFPVGKAGTTDLIILQDLAAVGSDLKGRKVAISLSAPWFFHPSQAPDSYAGNFSRAHAAAFTFSTDLSFGLKQAVAGRLVQYPQTLSGDPLLNFGLRQLAKGNRALYGLVLPLGKLDTLVYQLQDHWETLNYIHKQPKLNPVVVQKLGPEPNWGWLLAKATAEQKQNANNNPFGFENKAWPKLKASAPKQPAKTYHDQPFIKNVQEAGEWTDLDLLLRTVRELGGEPLVLSMPIQGTYYDWTGVSQKGRQVYYDKLSTVVKPYGVPLLDFADHDRDKYFLIDSGAHLSREGWVFYDEALDKFYHGTLR